MRIHPINELPSTIILGRQTETGVNEVRLDCAEWLALWPELNISIWVTPPGGDAVYPAQTHMESDVLVWTVNAADTAVAGSGTMEVLGVADGQRKLSAIATTRVLATTTITEGEVPDPARPWVEEVLEAADEAKESAENAADSAEQARESAESVQDFFIVTAAPKKEGVPVLYADKTQEEIREAVAAGKTCLLVYRADTTLVPAGTVCPYFGEGKYDTNEAESPSFFAGVKYDTRYSLWYQYTAYVRTDGHVGVTGKPIRTPVPQKLKLSGAVNATYDGSSEVTVEIPSGSLPETAEPLKQLVTDADGKVAWEDRLAYKYSTEGTVVNLPATEAIVVNDSGDMALTTPWTVEIEAGKTYTVNYNGTDYECLAIAMSAITPETPAGMCMLGNVQAMIEMEIAGNNPNAPFILATMSNALGAAEGAYAQVIPLDGAETVTIAVSYSGVKTDIKPIDPVLLGLKTIDIIVKDDGTVSCDFPFAEAWAMDERLLAASIRIITRETQYTSHTYRVWGNGYTVTRTERVTAEGYGPVSGRELHIVVPNVLDSDLSNTNAYETRFVWAEVTTEEGSYSDIALCGVQGIPIVKTGPKSYGPDYVSMMVALGFPASKEVSAGSYMRFDGSKWQAVTIDQLKADLGLT